MGENHKHSPESQKEKITRMNRIIGHSKSIKTMIEDDRDCSEILVQIAAVKGALDNLGKLILKDHMNTCIIEAIENGDEKKLEELNRAIDKLL